MDFYKLYNLLKEERVVNVDNRSMLKSIIDED